MRKIKLRFWYPELKEMFYSDNGNKYTFSLNEDGNVYVHEGYREIFDFDIVAMEYTGLKDKNGIDIYEGDLVRCFREGLSKVEFVSCGFGVTTRGKFTPFYELGGYCEIIGNIYENPELT